MAGLVCWNCGKSVDDVPLPISRHANCAACHEVLHCCRMCRHYTPDKRPYCAHDRADPPVEKEHANFCDYFKPTNRFDRKKAEKSDSAKSELNALFSDGEVGDGEDVAANDDELRNPDDPKNLLDDLFDD